MKSKLWIVALVLAACLLAAMPAMAADVFSFTDRSVTLFEGEMAETAVNQDGAYVNGDIVYTSESNRIATVAEDGTITAVSKGQTTINATLTRDGKRVRRTSMEVKVLRKVEKVTMSRKNLVILEPDDPTLDGLLAPLPEGAAPRTDPVLVLLAGRTVNLNTTCTPEDASSRKISYTSSDAGVAKIVDGNRLRAVEKGECDLEVASVQNPEAQEHFHVVVIEPVKKIQVSAPDKKMFAGTQMLLTAVCTPDTASIRKVECKSKRPSVATVDENGLVTALAKGDVTIEAKATDGTEVTASITLHVAQDVTEVTLKETDLIVSVKRSEELKATVLPREADNRKLIWTSSDESVATVSRDGRVTGKKAGVCVITCTSDSNPNVSASAAVQVVQPVTKIVFSSPSGQSFPIRESIQLAWNVEPADASIKDVTFKSNHPDIASVDENGRVTGLKRGEARIIATATDGSKRTGEIRVVVTQPVEGVTLSQQLYYVQRGRSLNIRANVLPKNANNQKVYWEVGDDSMASVRSNGTSTGRVSGGWRDGMTTVTAITEDGGYTASASLKVADFDAAVRVEGLEINSNNKIKIALWNTADFTVERVYFKVDCYDLAGNPMVYNVDGVTTGFDGTYPLPLQSGERSIHGQFWFNNILETGMLGEVVLTITGYQFDNGQRWEIPEEFQMPTVPVRSILYGTVTPTPMPPQNPTEGDGNA